VKAPEKSGAFSRLMSAGVHSDTVESSCFGGIFDGVPPKQLFGYHQNKRNPPIYPLCRSPPPLKSKNYKEKRIQAFLLNTAFNDKLNPAIRESAERTGHPPDL
jgi:hypothetical protein